MGLAEAFAPVEAVNKAIVMHDTWGHLKHEQRVKYHGKMLIAHTAWGQTVIIDYTFDIAGNPWFQEHLDDFAYDLDQNYELDLGKVYTWEGWFMEYKNGNPHWSGKLYLNP